MNLQQTAMDVEARARFLRPDGWNEAPIHVEKIAQEMRDEGIPTAIALDPILGWCVLFTGQGPGLAYVENENLLP